jgi:putative Holliday junction resolvase
MDGSRGPIATRVDEFKSLLQKETGIEVQLIDERLTSFEAEELLKPIIGNVRKRKKMIDSTAALIMLKNYFN